MNVRPSSPIDQAFAFYGDERNLEPLTPPWLHFEVTTPRPIAMGAGMLPIALKIGADADFRAPMAIAVIGGLITSTLLSLFYVPIVFTYVDDAKRWLTRSRKLETRTA